MEAIKSFSGEYEFLSNFYLAPVHYDLIYGNSEAAYQAQKAALICKRSNFCEYDPRKAKRKIRKLEIRSDWEEVKLAVMRDIVAAKFFQNPELAERLLATGERELIEGNYWHDTFWGIDLKTGEGQNYLGKILMELREELKSPEIVLSDNQSFWLIRFTTPKETTCAYSGVELEFTRKYELKSRVHDKNIFDCEWKFHGKTFTDTNFTDDAKEFVIFRDETGVHLIKYSREIPAINIYVGLKNSAPSLEKILEHFT